MLSLVHGVIPGEAPVCAQRVDRWLAVSPFVADHLANAERIGRSDIGVVANGIDLERFSAPPVELIRRPVQVLWASTYIPLRRKALESLAAAVLEQPDAELTVVFDRLPDEAYRPAPGSGS